MTDEHNDSRAAIDWDCIENFVGYGRPDAPVVFIGMEEGADNSRLELDLQNRSVNQEYAELVSLNKRQPTWSKMCDLMLRRSGNSAPSASERLTYQTTQLGKKSGQTLLLELMPYPRNKNADWPDIYRARFPSLDIYYEKMIPRRVLRIQNILKSHRRELIVCYGKGFWPHYEKIFSGAAFIKEGSHKVAKDGETHIVLAQHFTSRALNSEAQLRELAESALRPR
ncbi:MAG: hypothetical protein ACRDBH_01860 [Bosea sp. (in: a-proteobacteria)]